MLDNKNYWRKLTWLKALSIALPHYKGKNKLCISANNYAFFRTFVV